MKQSRKSRKLWALLSIILLASPSVISCTKKAESPETPALEANATATKASEITGRVFFVSPAPDATLEKKFKVVMGVEGLQVRPAGENPEERTSGHHHLIIDGAGIAEGQVIPADEKHIHFGKGQTEVDVELAPGEHTLTLQFADGAHRSYGPRMSSTIRITVK